VAGEKGVGSEGDFESGEGFGEGRGSFLKTNAKRFFFEKKNQKTSPGRFARVAPSRRGVGAKRGKVFWFFSSEKNGFLPSLPS
jgi:hypothetical protein